ncbi:hypothetical protein PMAYCL1PPCAC_21673 [Pristionchus mayeri]|uniref:Uncharacterized protein n=1 Tax=Pristionchus mayeri TaxID=1317129 RepID=A0AAN5I459_9BILA|nr:hypothetical protein PMAYCL1PPCAC_21673 [Pristionchus mayeri]
MSSSRARPLLRARVQLAREQRWCSMSRRLHRCSFLRADCAPPPLSCCSGAFPHCPSRVRASQRLRRPN